MTPLNLPWLEVAVLIPLCGAVAIGRVRDPHRASRMALVFGGVTLCCTLGAAADFFLTPGSFNPDPWDPLGKWFGRPIFGLDELSVALLPMTALVHFLTALATTRTKMRRFSFAWSQAAEAVRISVFSTREPWLLIGLLALGTVPPLFELRNRGKSLRVYGFHMALFVGLMVLGWGAVVGTAGPGGRPEAWATLPLLAAVLIRSGAFPAHCWLTDWFENASFGTAMLFALPLTGVYLAVRLVLPIAPEWALQTLGIVSLLTAVYAAGMATVQREARRFFAYSFLSHASLVLVGVELVADPDAGAISLTGALALWVAVALSLGGFGLTLRALEARFGRLSLADHHGLYEHCPTLAVCFLVTGLASVGFPGTLGFVATDLLVDGAVEAGSHIGLGVVLAAALNGIAVVRAYLLLFTGTRHVSTVSLNIGLRERVAVLTLTALILIGGLYPQPGIASRHRAAVTVIEDRNRHMRPTSVVERPSSDNENASTIP